eukprot:TRINITY_DN225_c0_g1_i1.p1 TRINITY_DN225_c0_g1~~TRINITY_DN225_c0_g1_i1.p1  ORF type:complete len:751 (+),score=186.03 TRINITY_DN225_c0_g1_i1:68-2320(+)
MFTTLTGMAMMASAAVTSRPCDQPPLKGSVLCDETKTTSERAQWIVGQLTIDEKISLLQNNAGNISAKGIPHYEWWSEALHGVGRSPGVTFDTETPCATSFPQVITTSASFNKTLWKSIGQTISTEARAMNNAGHAGLTFWTPNINLMRDPRWGRGQETPGEDPFATSTYAANFVPGFQEGEDPNHVKASSCCKHYYAYDLENWGGVNRHDFDAIITAQDEADTYLPAFHSCVVNGKATALMCSYNAVNGVPSCANGRIMNGFARGQWGFEGYITSDCGAVADVDRSHHYANSTQTPADVLQAGMDSDCGGYLGQFLKRSLSVNATKPSDIDTAAEHLFAVQIRLGMFDSPTNQPYLKYSYHEDVNTTQHQQLALEAAQQGMVLLKNTNKVFPLSTTNIKTVAVIGPNSAATGVMQGNYQGDAPYLISPRAGIQKYVNVTYAMGCDIECASNAGFSAATKAAGEADATVIVIGISSSQEGEGHDRTQISLPGHQEQLIGEVAEASKGPVMVVVMAGGSIDFSVAKTNDKVAGIMWVGYPGQSGGDAIADVIFGAYNPGGRLPHTQYAKDYINNLSMLDMSFRPNASTNNPGRTYRFFTGTPVYAYGSGLSYTTFSYSSSVSDISISKSLLDAEVEKVNAVHQYSDTKESVENALTSVTITVKNTGDVAGSDVVLAFSKPPTPGKDGQPLKSLIGFERVFLQPGESKTLTFPVTVNSVSLADKNGEFAAVGGQWNFVVGPEDELELPMFIK